METDFAHYRPETLRMLQSRTIESSYDAQVWGAYDLCVLVRREIQMLSERLGANKIALVLGGAAYTQLAQEPEWVKHYMLAPSPLSPYLGVFSGVYVWTDMYEHQPRIIADWAVEVVRVAEG